MNTTNASNPMLVPASNTRLSTVYQPIVDHLYGEVFAVEALSRPCVDGIPVSPEAWFRAAHRNNQGLQADICALRTAITGFSAHHTNIPLLFVNVMPSSLIHPEFPAKLDEVLSDTGYPASQLVVEITESGSNIPELLHAMQHLRQRGIAVALDDVGKGRADLRRLVELEPNFIKVDRALVRNIATSVRRQRLLALLVQFMGVKESVIAEGLENDRDLCALSEAGVALSQGHHWTPPVALEELVNFQVQVVNVPDDESNISLGKTP